MCGHVGIFGKVDARLYSVFEVLINLDIARGWDSTGMGFIRKDGSTRVIKKLGLPYRIMRDKAYVDALNDKNNIGIIGHNRAATKGVINAENAHPHKEGNITLAHNGTLSEHCMNILPDHNKFTNDSKLITHDINTRGLAEFWKDLYGAATLVYWDKGQQSLVFVSNGQRPFTYAYIKEYPNTVVWASEEKMLKHALAIHDLHIDEDEKGKDKLFVLANHRSVTHFIEGGQLDWYTEELEPFRYRHIGGATKGTGKAETGQANGQKTEVIGSPNNIVPFSTNNAVTLPVPKGDASTKMSEAEFVETYKNCVMCGMELKHEYEKAMIVDGRHAVCGDCLQCAHETGMRIH